MQTLYIYNATNYQDHIDNKAALQAPVAEFTGANNEACEQLAKDNNYDDSDLFAWSYAKWRQ